MDKNSRAKMKDVLDYIKNKDEVTYSELVSEFCPTDKKYLRAYLAHNLRQKIWYHIKKGTIKSVSRGVYKYMEDNS